MKLLKNTDTVFRTLSLSLTLAFTIANGAMLFAQETPKQMEEVTIVGDFAPTVTEANKILKNPILRDTVIEMPALQYSILSTPWMMQFPVAQIQTLRYKAEDYPVYQRNYARVGFGTYTTPLIEFFAGKTQSKTSAFGIHFRHLSSQGDGEGIFANGFSLNDVDAYGKLFSRRYAITLSGAYNRHALRYYGFDTTGVLNPAIPSDDSLRQVFNRFHASVSFTSLANRQGVLNHAFGVRFRLLTDHFESNELQLNTHLNLDYDVELFEGSRKQKLGLNTRFDYFGNQWAVISTLNASLLQLHPFYSIEFDEYSLKMGATVSMASDSSSTWKIAPEARAGVSVIKNVLEVYAGVRGGVYRNTIEKLTAINPFVQSTVQPSFSNTTFELFGGFKTSLSHFVDFSGTVSSAKVDNMALYYHPVAIGGLQNQLGVLYDNVSLLRVSGELSFQKKESVRLIIGGAYQSASPTREERVWYSPEMEGWLIGEFNITPKLKLKATAKAFGTMVARVDSVSNAFIGSPLIKKIVNIDPYVDLSAGVEYRFTPRLSAFADLNNVLTSHYEYWYRYKNYGINVLAGITFGF